MTEMVIVELPVIFHEFHPEMIRALTCKAEIKNKKGCNKSCNPCLNQKTTTYTLLLICIICSYFRS